MKAISTKKEDEDLGFYIYQGAATRNAAWQVIKCMRNTMGGNEVADSWRCLIVSFKWHNGAIILSFLGVLFFSFFHVLLSKQCMLQRDSPYQCFQ